MRIITITFLIFSVFFILNGCNNKTKEEESSQEVNKPSLIKEHQFDLDSIGTFYRYNKVEDIGTYETGPITMTVELAETVKGSITKDFRSDDKNAYESMEIINFQVRFELNKEVYDDITFSNEKNIHLSTDTGEVIQQPFQFMSSVVNMSLLKNNQEYNNGSHLRQFTFRLKESTAQDIEKATLIIDSPVNSSGEPLGEDLEVEVDFSKSNN